jgi:protein O-GlcNAc transferase
MDAIGPTNLRQQLECAVAHHQAGRLVEAEALYRQVLAHAPGHADAMHLLGVVAAQTERLDLAEELMRGAIRIKPDLAQAHNNLGSVLARSGRFDEAIPFYRRAIEITPDFADAHNNLGFALNAKGQLDPAIAACREATRLNPQFAEAYINLGNGLQGKGRLEDAIACFREAVRLKPGLAESHNNLGNVLRRAGRLVEAIASYQEAIRLNPDIAEAHLNLSMALDGNWQFDEAIAANRTAIRLKPDSAEAFGTLGNSLCDMGQIDEAISSYREAMRLKPDFSSVHSNLLFVLNYHSELPAEEILADHQAWSDQHARPLMSEIIPHANERSPERRLRIGYVSADLRRHPVADFFVSLLEHHDRKMVEVFCYASVTFPDDMTDRVSRSSDVWRNVLGVNDEALAGLVRSDGIDILVDLSGHSAGDRLRAFARKPAPIQVTYLGYANTTGMSAIDFRFTDALADPPGMTDKLNVERLWRLPVCNWCYLPPANAPDIQPRGVQPITFGCFNAFPKVNRKMTAIWAQLLKSVPGSHLLLKSAAAAEVSSRQRFTSEFTERGISGDRIEIIGRVESQRDHLAIYQHVDVALDTFPYHGTTTTCEALWMGVPVVSLAGRTHVSRVGVSLLTNAGVPELIAQTPEEYLSIASKLATDSAALDALRAGLRDQMRCSPLTNSARFAKDIEEAYRQMWREWCAKP